MRRNLHNLESKANINQMFINRVDLSKLSDVVNNDVKIYVYNTKIKGIEDKVPDITNLATNSTLNNKTNEIKNK